MLILTRRVRETLMIGDDVTVTVLAVKGNQVRIGVNAPREIAVHREEVYERIQKEQKTLVRKSDTTEKKYYRSPDRIISREGQWYFQTRQGDRGPYDTREAAELRLERYVDTMGFVEENKPWLPSDVD